MAKIHEAIAAIMSEGAAIGKDSKNLQQGYKYRGVEAVMNVFNPLLSKHGVFVYPEVLNQIREARTNSKGNTLLYSILTIRYHFAADDGSEVCATVIGEGMDSGDKASNKAMSVAFKYAMFQMFCVPTEEMVDPDSENPDIDERNKSFSKPQITCECCGKPIQAKRNNGTEYNAETIAANTRKKFGKTLCWDCGAKLKAES